MYTLTFNTACTWSRINQYSNHLFLFSVFFDYLDDIVTTAKDKQKFSCVPTCCEGVIWLFKSRVKKKKKESLLLINSIR